MIMIRVCKASQPTPLPAESPAASHFLVHSRLEAKEIRIPMSFDEMCAAGNEIVPQLPHAERLFLWATRVWSAYHDDVSAIWRTLDRTFTEARIKGALQPFDVMMDAIFIGLHRWPDIRCARCPRLGQDEARLLDTLRLLQRDDREGAITLLRVLAAPAAARKACAAAAQVLDAMNRSGLRFSITQSLPAAPHSCRDSTHFFLTAGQPVRH